MVPVREGHFTLLLKYKIQEATETKATRTVRYKFITIYIPIFIHLCGSSTPWAHVVNNESGL